MCHPVEGGAREAGPVFERHPVSGQYLSMPVGMLCSRAVSSHSIVSCRDQSPPRTGAQRALSHSQTSAETEKAPLLLITDSPRLNIGRRTGQR